VISGSSSTIKILPLVFDFDFDLSLSCFSIGLSLLLVFAKFALLWDFANIRLPGKQTASLLPVGVTGEGKPILLGSAIYSADSKGKLAYLNNVISFFKVEVDTEGNFLSIERELK
jgi:hypothetical protein